jgi:hypothetical protein
MLKLLMLVSGIIEVLFGVSTLFAPLAILEAVGAQGGSIQLPTLAMVSLLGAATLGLGVGALFGRNHLDTAGGMATAYALGLYNIIGAIILVLFAKTVASDPGLWAGTILHIVMAVLFIYAFVKRR